MKQLPLITKLVNERRQELLDLEGYNPLNAGDKKIIDERRDEALRLRAEFEAVKRAAADLADVGKVLDVAYGRLK